MALHISAELEQRVAALAQATGRDPDTVAAEILDASVERYELKLAKVRAELQRADASPNAAPGLFNRVRERLGLPVR
jgi:predicted transcriptional regulator